MQINVAQLLKSPIGAARSYRMSEEVIALSDSDSITVEGEVTLLRVNRGLLARCSLHTELDITCSRCLRTLNCPLTLSIEEEYYPTIDITSGNPLPAPDEPDAPTIGERHILDLTEVIRQYVLMSIPMKPLCREDCAGLCPTCGHNLNQGACQCPPREIDPRWSKLIDYISSDSELRPSRAE